MPCGARGIIFAALRHFRRGNRPAATRLVFPGVEIGKGPVFGRQHIADQRQRPVLHRGPFGFRDIGGARPGKGSEKACVLRFARDRPGDRVFKPAKRSTGLDIALVERTTADSDTVTVELGISGEPSQIAAIVGPGLERQAIRQIGETLVPALIGRKQHHPLAKAIGLDLFGKETRKHTLVGPLRIGKAGFGNGGQPVEQGFCLRGVAILRFERVIVDPVVMNAHAEPGGRNGIGFKVEGPVVVDHLAEFGRGRRPGRRSDDEGKCGEDRKSHDAG